MGPLAGIRVVEMAGLGAAPLCGMMLADQGARVISIERASGSGPESSLHVHEVDPLTRGKLRLPLDLKCSRDVSVLLDIIAQSHVLLESFRPGVMERLGLGPEECFPRNPALVYARLSGWGQSGPWAHRAGHDPNYIAATGALYHSGSSAHPPLAPPTLLGDGAAAVMLSGAIASALIPALQRGTGQVIDAAIAECASYLSTYAQSFYQAGHITDQRASGWLDGAAPWNSVYATRDHLFMAVAAVEPQFYRELLVGLELLEHAAFADGNQWRTEQWPSQRQHIADRFAERDRGDWEAAFASLDACVSSVMTYGETASHPQFSARGAHFESRGQVFPQPAPRFSATPSVPGAEPTEQATQDYLAELGIQI